MIRDAAFDAFLATLTEPVKDLEGVRSAFNLGWDSQIAADHAAVVASRHRKNEFT